MFRGRATRRCVAALLAPLLFFVSVGSAGALTRCLAGATTEDGCCCPRTKVAANQSVAKPSCCCPAVEESPAPRREPQNGVDQPDGSSPTAKRLPHVTQGETSPVLVVIRRGPWGQSLIAPVATPLLSLKTAFLR